MVKNTEYWGYSIKRIRITRREEQMTEKIEKSRLDIIENKLDTLMGCIGDLEALIAFNKEKIKWLEERLK